MQKMDFSWQMIVSGDYVICNNVGLMFYGCRIIV